MHDTSKYKNMQKGAKMLMVEQVLIPSFRFKKCKSLQKETASTPYKKGLLSISVKFVCPPFITSFNQSKSKAHRRDEREGKVKECVVLVLSYYYY